MKAFLSKLASVHQAHWRYDSWYRRAWFVWPQAGALLAILMIFDPSQPASAPAAPWAKPTGQSSEQPKQPPSPPQQPQQQQQQSQQPQAPANNQAPAATAVSKADQDACSSNDANTALVACNRIIETVAQNDPYLADAYFFRARARDAKGQPDLAIEDLTKSIAIRPGAYGSLNYRGALYRNKKQYDLAIADFIASSKLNPSWSYPHANLAEVYRLKGDYDLAAAKLADALKLDAKNAWTLNVKTRLHDSRREWREAVATASEWIGVAPTDSEAYYRRGVAESQMKDHRAAVADLDEATRRGYRNEVLFLNRGFSHEQLGNIDQALVDFTEAIKIEPKSAYAHTRRAQLYFNKGLLNDAMSNTDAAIAINGKDADSRVLRAKIWMAGKSYEAAVRDLDQVLQLQPRNGYLRYLRGEAYLFGEMAIIEPCRKFGHPTANRAEWPLGVSKSFRCVNGPDLAGAIRDFDEALRLNPELAGAYANRGTAYISLGNRQQAEKDWRMALKLDPSNKNLIAMMQQAGIRP